MLPFRALRYESGVMVHSADPMKKLRNPLGSRMITAKILLLPILTPAAPLWPPRKGLFRPTQKGARLGCEETNHRERDVDKGDGLT